MRLEGELKNFPSLYYSRRRGLELLNRETHQYPFPLENCVVDEDKIGMESPDNRMFYARVWDKDKNEMVDRLIDTEELK